MPPAIPSHYGPRFSPQDFADLAPYFDGFSVMTYDASNPEVPGPNAPAHWVEGNLEALLPEEDRYDSHSFGLNQDSLM